MAFESFTITYDSKGSKCEFVAGLITAALLRKEEKLANKFTLSERTGTKVDERFDLNSNCASICRLLCHSSLDSQNKLYAVDDPTERTLVDSWISCAKGVHDESRRESFLKEVNSRLEKSELLVGKNLSLADIFVWSYLVFSDINYASFGNIKRWASVVGNKLNNLNAFEYLPEADKKKMQEMYKRNEKSKSAKKDETSTAKSTVSREEGKYVDLPGAEMGKVVVRFPPEASGYLHIGHAKAALLNQYYQLAFNGKLVFRFDDTNPEKEKEDYEQVIREDVELLRIKPDQCTYTSDYFDLFLEKCEELIKGGKAYVDDTAAEEMKQEREQRIESKNRNNSVEKNLQMWSEMKNGTEYGQKCCVRAKIDMNSDNGCMRDPALYRCKNQAHPRTGNKYHVYPTYDFACPIVDSVEGITHALRTTEYTDRDAQYYWVIDALGIRKPYIWAYSRLNMMNTLLSKRKLTWFVENGIVDGWDDPRMPTVRGVLRRGLTVDGLKEFIMAQGSSRSVVFMEWDKIWSFNKKVIDPIAPRYMAVEALNAVTVHVSDGDEGYIEVQVHPKNQELGKRSVKIGKKLLIDQLDASSMKEGDNVTFINWGNLMVNKIVRDANGLVTNIHCSLNLDNKDFKKTLKVTWIEASNPIEANVIYYEHLVMKPQLGKDDDFKDFLNDESKKEMTFFVEDSVKTLKQRDIIQILRKGFFICDAAASESSHVKLISVPDGSTDMNIFPKVIQEWKLRLKEKSASMKVSAESSKQKSSNDQSKTELDLKIREKGEQIRVMKSAKKSKEELKPEIDCLLKLKADYKTITGCEWKPEDAKSSQTTKQQKTNDNMNSAFVGKSGSSSLSVLDSKIVEQGNRLRKLKSEKKSKEELKPEIDLLLKLKEEYKSITGSEWKPTAAGDQSQTKKVEENQSDASQLDLKIKEQGDKIRRMKNEKKNKDELKPEIELLLKLKEDYKALTNIEWKPSKESVATLEKPEEKTKKQASNEKSKSANKGKETKKEEKQLATGVKKQTRLGLEVRKSENLADWYTEVITKSELIEYYDVSGCYILRPWAFSIWEFIQSHFDERIKTLGVKNCYFPMFVSSHALEKEKTHIADFAPEVAWVTKSGSSDLIEPIAIRPTSETVMYPSFRKWIQSHRDLPIKVNQWCNVVRWEFKNPTPFLRTREFLWQEGHTAHMNREDAVEEVYNILDFYTEVYEKLLAIPVIKGTKTGKEKFAGGEFSTTLEAYVAANGRGVQAATSHHLAQNYSKMFEIDYENPNKPGERVFVHQNSWGLSTRSIGVMIMVHSDDKGLVLPPNVADIQVIIIPCGITVQTSEEEKQTLLQRCQQLQRTLVNGGVRAECDLSDHNSPGWKYNHWELKGVPIRVELGPKDLKENKFVAVRRDSGIKTDVTIDHAVEETKKMLADIHTNLFNTATKIRDEHLVVTDHWSEFVKKLDEKCIIMAPFCGRIPCEDEIKQRSAKEDESDASGPLMGAKSLCVPHVQPKKLEANQKCINCTEKAQSYTLFGRSY